MARAFGFSWDTPIREWTPEQRRQFLYGSDTEYIVEWRHPWGEGRYVGRHSGIIPHMQRRLQTTKSEGYRHFCLQFMRELPCPLCGGTRLRKESAAVTFQGRSIVEISRMSVGDARAFFDSVRLGGSEGRIAGEVLQEVRGRLSFLVNVGLHYLSLDRTGATLSGGEAQRIRLASQIGSGLVGVLYILDEPSIGLHQRDTRRLLDTLTYLRDLGNTVLVIEHDPQTVRAADFIVDLGPGAGAEGGHVVATGPPSKIARATHSITGKYLSGRKRIPVRPPLPVPRKHWLEITGCRLNNLRRVRARFPLARFVCVTGVSGSGKSS
jgi:excinuclease ABC subunit A